MNWLRAWFLLFFGKKSNVTTDAIFVPGLCLAEDRSRLAYPNEDTMRFVAALISHHRAKMIIYSSNINPTLAKAEADLRTKLLIECGVDGHQLIPLADGSHSQTQDEVNGLRKLLETRIDVIKSITLVTDRWQMGRLWYAAQELLPQSVEICAITNPFRRFERTAENGGLGRLKPILWKYRLLWIARNIIGLIVTPLLIRKYKKKTELSPAKAT